MPAGIPSTMGFWEWLWQLGIGLQGDWELYEDRKLGAVDYENALRLATQRINALNNPTIKTQYYEFLKEEGALDANSDAGYYARGEASVDEFNHLIRTATNFYSPATEGAGGSTQALPRNAKLVNIGGTYRVVWSLGDNLGWAWYNITGDQLKNVYGTTTPAAHFNLQNIGQFESQFGNNYWGNAAEISLKAETPWEDLKERIFNQFGFVPGMDQPDVRRLMIQAYFEDWNQNQFLVEYRNTPYFQQTTDTQRKWVGLSEAEKNQTMAEIAIRLSGIYESHWGQPISSGHNDIRDAAFKIASGQMTEAEWEYNTRLNAAAQPESPEARRLREEQEAQRAEGNQIENLTAFAEQQWRSWIGPVAMPAEFATRWGRDLAAATASEADLQNYLKSISNSRWTFKPPDVTWEDWAAPYRQQVKETLELGSLDNSDPLLSKILSQDPSGVDLDVLIRQDQRFLSTRRMFSELANSVEDMGRRFGFIT